VQLRLSGVVSQFGKFGFYFAPLRVFAGEELCVKPLFGQFRRTLYLRPSYDKYYYYIEGLHAICKDKPRQIARGFFSLWKDEEQTQIFTNETKLARIKLINPSKYPFDSRHPCSIFFFHI
jgi:hypothetical protein